MIGRRPLLAGAAGLPLAAPRLGRAQAARPLRFVPFADLAVRDPLATPSLVTRDHALMVYDTLFGLDAALRPQPQMLAGAATEQDGRLWRLTLRDGLRFHDGAPVLARDAVASLQRWGRADSFGQALFAATDELTAADDRTLVFRLQRPFPRLPDALAKVTGLLPVIMPERHAARPAGQPLPEVIGSGPFRFRAEEMLAGSRYAYERFAGYRPRPEGSPSGTAGPKRALLDRVEWQIIPDASTAANALAAGEIDWWNQVLPDSIPPLRRNRALLVEACEATGYVGFLQPNHRHPPFDNPAIRRALLAAVRQADFGAAVMGDDPSLWRDGLGFFCPGTPLANDAGRPGPPDLDAARRAIAAAGYAGEKVVILAGADVGFVLAMNLVAADLLRRLGMQVEVQQMDVATLLQRRLRTEPPERGGWNLYAIGSVGLQTLDPAVNTYLRGHGGPFGFLASPALEAARQAWFDAPDLPAQQQAARRLQELAMQDVPYIPLGQFLVQTAYRAELRRGVKEISVFWELERR